MWKEEEAAHIIGPSSNFDTNNSLILDNVIVSCFGVGIFRSLLRGKSTYISFYLHHQLRHDLMMALRDRHVIEQQWSRHSTHQPRNINFWENHKKSNRDK